MNKQTLIFPATFELTDIDIGSFIIRGKGEGICIFGEGIWWVDDLKIVSLQVQKLTWDLNLELDNYRINYRIDYRMDYRIN